MFPDSVILRPAYGRRYLTEESIIEAWNNGLDFKLPNGQYCSIRDKKGLLKDWGDYIILQYTNGRVTVAKRW